MKLFHRYTDHEVVERVRRLNRRRNWLGWSCIVVGVGLFALSLFLLFLRTSKALEVTNMVSTLPPPLSEGLIEVSLRLAYSIGLHFGFKIGTALGAMAVAVHIGISLLSERRQGEILVALFVAREGLDQGKITK